MSWLDVNNALDEMVTTVDPDWKIDGYVYSHALKTANAMSEFPAPRIIRHGPNSVVFAWSSFYLTITAEKIIGSVSVSSR